METISRNEFREIIGWTTNNYPLSCETLNYINELSGSKIGGTRIGNKHYTLYYKCNVMKDIVLFPIIIANKEKCFIANDKKDLIDFVEHPILDKNFEEKVEKMVGCDYKKIRSHEITFSNRIPFDELYSWSKEEFYGYKYVEF